MPVIFNLQERVNMKIKIIEVGFELIKQLGMKKMTVEKITKAVGLAKGTFYNFFESKERFVYEIIVYKRDLLKKSFQEMVGVKGYLTKEEALRFFSSMWQSDENIYAYLTQEDVTKLMEKLPKEYFINPNADRQTTLTFLKYIKGIKKNCDYKIVANFMKMIALIMENRQLFHEQVLEQNIALIMDTFEKYAFED